MLPKTQKILIGNWKMNPSGLEDAVSLAGKVEKGVEETLGVGVGLAPPFPFLAPVGKVLRTVKLGAQDTFWKDKGAYTGEVSPDQLKSLGVSFVIEGHSERREYSKEDDEMIGKEVRAGLGSGLDVILCIGEPGEVREKGVEESKRFVRKQLKKDLKKIREVKFGEASLYLAYEPIWAISSQENSKPASVEDVVEMSEFIRSFTVNELSVPLAGVFYGGSTDSENIVDFLGEESVDGALVGSSSLDADEFIKMVEKTSNFI